MTVVVDEQTDDKVKLPDQLNVFNNVLCLIVDCNIVYFEMKTFATLPFPVSSLCLEHRGFAGQAPKARGSRCSKCRGRRGRWARVKRVHGDLKQKYTLA